jgi:hypothetical protein
MKRETIAIFWAIGIGMLVISLLIPWAWIRVEVPDANTDLTSNLGLNIDLSKAEPAFIATVTIIYLAVLTGIISLIGIILWSRDGKTQIGDWGILTIILIIIAVITFNVHHPIYSHEVMNIGNSVIGEMDMSVTWYPHIGFFLVIFSLFILTVTQYLFQKASAVKYVKCPKCGRLEEVKESKRPLDIPCSGCGVVLRLK